MIARIVGMAVGIWLMFAPEILGYGSPAADTDRIFGPIGAALAFVAMWEVLRPLRLGTLPVGLWLVLAPFVLTYESSGAIVSSFLSGVAFTVTAPLGGDVRKRHGGGWSSLAEVRAPERAR